MFDYLLFPLHFVFMQKGIAITIIIALPMALLSCFLVLKGWSLLGDAISHAIFPGVVLGYMVTPSLASLLLSLNIVALQGFTIASLSEKLTMGTMAVGAFIAGMVCAVLTGFLSYNSRIKPDSVMGVVFSAMFGLGLVLSLKIESELHLNHILFGNLLGVSFLDIIQTACIALSILAILVMKWRDFLLFSFDPIQAKAAGLSLRFYHYALLTMIALAIVAALKAIGTILAIALLIAPGAIAYLMTKRFSTMMLIALCIAGFCSFFGIYLSAFIGSDSASTIVLLMTLIFIITYLYIAIKQKISFTASHTK